MRFAAFVSTLAGLLLQTSGISAQIIAQDVAEATSAVKVSFAFERAGLPVPRYTLSVNEQGSARYVAVEGTESIERMVTLSRATTEKLFATVRGVRIGPGLCASKAKNVADTGTKTLTYVTDDGSAGCTYNYSDNKNVQLLTAIFQGVAETLDEGRTLERLHRFDRLGLDAEMMVFAQEVAAGHAIETGTIADCLKSIADDPDVIERVRAQAKRLLAENPANATRR